MRPSSPAADEILNRYFPVLNHGFVALVDYMGNDEEIERAARVSYTTGGRKVSDTRTLLRHLRRHKHTTPSEMVELKFHCCMPIFIARQWIRHRTASVNEMSGRYSLLPMLFYTPPEAQFKKQSKTNKQGRSDEGSDYKFYRASVESWESIRRASQEQYEDLTADGIARELARIDFPLSTYTQRYWKIDLHNLLHFLTLRVDSHAQWEIQEYGKIIAGMMKRVAPLSYEAWIDYEVCGVRLSRMERAALASMLEVADARITPHGLGLGEVTLNGYGIAGRELTEMFDKLVPQTVPDFELDLSKTVDGTVFEERFRAAVPKGDQP